MKDTYSKEEIARILRERPEVYRLMKLIIDQPEDKRAHFIEIALEHIEGQEKK